MTETDETQDIILDYDKFIRIMKLIIKREPVFLLGAGASKTSDIPTAPELIWKFKEEIYKSNNSETLDVYNDLDPEKRKTIVQKWLDEQGSYPVMGSYDEYSFYVEDTYHTISSRKKYFTDICLDKEPSRGYTLLCALVKSENVQNVFTTNFDDLITIAAYSIGITPIEIRRENMDDSYKQERRGHILKVFKLHGDYKYGELKNTRDELDSDPNSFNDVLSHFFKTHDLIVMGYSGRDKTLMDSLEIAYKETGNGELYWCGYEDSMSEDVEKLIKSINQGGRDAHFIPNCDFDQTIHDIIEHCKDDKDLIKLKNILKDLRMDEGEKSLVEDIKETSFVIRDELEVRADFPDEFIVASMIGSWDENSSGDREIIGKFAGMDYFEWIKNIRELLRSSDPPITLDDGVWNITDRKAVWQEIATRIYDDDLDNYSRFAVAVLSEIDPQFELEPERRFAKTLYGKKPRYSKYIRKGLAETLALIGTYEDSLSNCSSHKPKNTPKKCLYLILNQNWKRWGSLNDLLPILAESSPTIFLKIVDETIRVDNSPFVDLFNQESGGVTGRSYMTGLLWSLECLAWSEEHLVLVSAILGQLAALDPGGNWSNRPDNSLKTILLPWYPQTTADVEKRISAIKAVKNDDFDIAWHLLLELLPSKTKVSSGSYKPRWRKFIPDDWEEKVTDKEYEEQVTSYAEILIDMAKKRNDRLHELAKSLANLPPSAREDLLEYLSSDEISNLPEHERTIIWENIISLVKKHRKFEEAKWALDVETVDRIEKVANLLKPAKPQYLYRRLFSTSSHELHGKKGSWREQEDDIEDRRNRAIHKILDDGGLNDVIKFIDSIENPHQVGWSLGTVSDNDIDGYLLPSFLDKNERKFGEFIAYYIRSRYYSLGVEWLDGFNQDDWEIDQICELLLNLPFEQDIWSRAEYWLGSLEHLYWEKIQVTPLSSHSDMLPAVDKLLSVHRPLLAIECLYANYYHKNEFDIELALEALTMEKCSRDLIGSSTAYYITEVIKLIHDNSDIGIERLSKIEWIYLYLLNRFDVEPKNIEKRLSTEPEFFYNFIQILMSSNSDSIENEERTEYQEFIVNNTWRLLSGWKRPPGLQDDGTFSTDEFFRWLSRVKDICKKEGHLEIVLNRVGKVLFYVPPDPGGLWINKEVALELNSCITGDMRKGFEEEVINSRGVHFVDPSGKPERDLAEKWRLKAENVEREGFVRFAQTLKDIANMYDEEAERIIATNTK